MKSMKKSNILQYFKGKVRFSTQKIKSIGKLNRSKPVNLWKQIDKVINSKHLTGQSKQIMIDQIRNLAIPASSNKGNIYFTEGPITQFWSTLLEFYPELLIDLKERNIKFKDISITKEVFFEYALKLLMFVIVVSLRQKHDISKSVFIVHMTLLMSAIVKCFPDGKDVFIATDTFNDRVAEIATFDIHIAQVNVKGWDSTTRSIWKIIIKLIDILIEHQILIERLDQTSRPTNLEADMVDSSRGTKKARYHMKVLSLNKDFRNEIDPFVSLFFDEWPQIVPKVVKLKDKDNHLVLSKGLSELKLNQEGKETLNIVNSLPLFYNLSLYKEAKSKVIGNETFTLLNNLSLPESIRKVRESREVFIEQKIIPRGILKIEKLETIRLYFENSGNSPLKWIKSLCRPKGKDEVWKAHFKKLELANNSFIDLIVSNLLKYLIQKFKTLDVLEVVKDWKSKWGEIIDEYLVVIKQIEHYLIFHIDTNIHKNIDLEVDFSLDKCYLDYFKVVKSHDLESHINSCIDDLKSVLYLIRVLGIDKLSNLKMVGKTFSQKKCNIFTYWSVKLVKGVYLNPNFESLMNEWNKYSLAYMKTVKDYSILLSALFKEQMMNLYKKVPFYFTARIAVNGRLGYKGFAPHPHSGEIFRFIEAKKELVNEEGLRHLKLAISSVLGNKFKTNEEHLKWFTDNVNSLRERKKESIMAYTYLTAFEKTTKNLPVGTLIRVDQVASAITYWGLLSGCSDYQKFTNLGVLTGRVDTYSEISRLRITPVLKSIESQWTEKIDKLKNSVIHEEILRVLNEVWIPGSFDRKFLKYLLMPHAYGLTVTGVEDQLIKYGKDIAPGFNYSTLRSCNWFKQLSLKLWHTLNQVSPRTTRLKKIIQKTYSLIQAEVSDNEWSTIVKHSDCCISWDYKMQGLVQKSFWDPKLQYSRNIYVNQMTNERNCVQNELSFLPLFVHSIDAAVIRSTIRICREEYKFTPVTIHDCGLSHPNNTSVLIQTFKRSIFEVLGRGKLTNKTLLENIWLYPSLTVVDKKISNEIINKWEKLWNKSVDLEIIIESNKIFNSPYNFSYE